MKLFSVIGFHNSGKTTLITKLIQHLKRLNLTSSTIKNIHNKINLENENNDTAKHFQYTHDFSAGISENSTFIHWKRKMKIQDIMDFVKTDFLIIEGMKSYPFPKIVCATTQDDVNKLVDETTFAIVSSQKLSSNIPLFSHSEVEKLTYLILEKIFPALPYHNPKCCTKCGLSCGKMTAQILQGLKQRSDCVVDTSKKISIVVDKEQISLVPFVENMLYDSINALISNLHGGEKGDISIQIKR